MFASALLISLYIFFDISLSDSYSANLILWKADTVPVDSILSITGKTILQITVAIMLHLGFVYVFPVLFYYWRALDAHGTCKRWGQKRGLQIFSVETQDCNRVHVPIAGILQDISVPTTSRAPTIGTVCIQTIWAQALQSLCAPEWSVVVSPLPPPCFPLLIKKWEVAGIVLYTMNTFHHHYVGLRPGQNVKNTSLHSGHEICQIGLETWCAYRVS